MVSPIITVGSSILKMPTGPDAFTIPTPPTSSSSSAVVIAPTFGEGITGKCGYRPWSNATLDGLYFFANGYDQPWRWAGDTKGYSIGAAAPTTFSVSVVAGSGTFADGTSHTYYLVFYNSTTGKETAPQQTAGVPGVTQTNSSGGARDFKIDWTDPAGEYDKARIYRRLQNSDNYKLVATVTASTATYTDTTTDATLDGAGAAYVTTYRATVPPIFDWITAYQGRLFGGFRDSPNVHYAQAVRIDSRNVTEDFPDAWILQPGAEDGTGGNVAMVPHYAAAYFFKRDACYEMTGTDIATWAIRKINADRGAISERCIVALDENALILDERGLYWWTTSGEAVVAGSAQGARESPLQPTWDRMNLAAADTFFAIKDHENRIAMFFIALDYEPTPNVAVIFDYGRNQFVGIDTAVWATAGGILRDAMGEKHLIRACDLGYAWEIGWGESGGVFAGDNTATLTTATHNVLEASAATFDTTTVSGVPGAPYERYDTDGTLLELNRVADATASVLTPFYFSTDTPAVDQTVAIGVIPAVARTPRMTLGTPEKKWVRGVVIEHDNGVSGTLRVDTAINEGSFTLQKEPSLLTNIRTIVPVSDRCWTWSVQFSQRYANLGFTIRGVHIEYVGVPGQRQ